MQEEHLQYLIQAFRDLERVQIPEVGLFTRMHQPARFDPQTQQLFPPSERFRFDPKSHTDALPDFVELLKIRFHISENEAKTVLEHLSRRFQEDLHQTGRVQLPEIGVLRLIQGGLLVFDSEELNAADQPVNTSKSHLNLTATAPYAESPTAVTAPVIEKAEPKPKADAEASQTSAADAKTVSPVVAEPAKREPVASVPNQTPPTAKTVSKTVSKPKVTPQKAAGRTPVETAALVVLTLLLLSILVGLVLFRQEITQALGIDGKSSELAAEDLEGEMLSGEGFHAARPDGRAVTSQPPVAGQAYYHIIVGSEKGKGRASKRLSEWQAKGYDAMLLPGKGNNSYRISIYRATDLISCDKKLAELKLHSLVPYDTWTLKATF